VNFAGLTGQIRDSSRMKAKRIKPDSEPILVREGSVSVKIYTTTNRIYRVNPANGQRELKSEHPQFTLAYYSGMRRVKLKFADLAEARREADRAVAMLANGDSESLKLTGLDRASYVSAMQKLREWRVDVDLGSAVADYVGAVKRLSAEGPLGNAGRGKV
jgi:hypothetical protein